ncbi:acyl-CoA dehydrogenase family protein [Galactobacter caseinivorans]|uniref:Dibenzothiophene monooxygenase n=1 Tax=Galactobacter caseinivorans TaxID=2676123 RepID=A0A496PFC6_9MICC|nr:acyl-CoA dehydrogenase family protein [Galactobacter caseinivorans]RKW69419.1 acyl-CoA dehydrogenase [Galactobacter caseinivorans]
MSVTPTRGTRGPSRTKPISYEEASLRFSPALALIAAGSLERELHRELPFEAVDTLDELGFGALRVPTEYGGAGATVETLVRILIDVAEADSNVAQLYRSHLGFVESLRFQRAERQDYWYPRVVAGETVGNASTERGGNALGSLNTTLRQGGGGWEVSGTKFYSTGTIFSDHTRVSAAHPDGPGRRFAVVPTDAAGVSIEDDWDGFGQRLTGTGTTTFDRVRVPPEALFECAENSPESVHESAFFQLVLLAVLAGIARAARRDAVATIAVRKRTFNTGSGVPFREDPLIQEAVGRLSAKAFGAEAAVLAAARALDEALAALALAGADQHDFQGQPPYELILGEIAVEQAQVLVPELALGAAQQLFETVGASATSTSKGLDRHWRNAQTIATHNPLSFRARSVGDFHLNGTLPEALTAIGDAAPRGRR